jgi:tryptophan synthase beta subunit
MQEIKEAFFALKTNQTFLDELHALYRDYVGRPSPLIFASRLTQELGGAKIYLKNEGTNHTGAHKINHCVGQALVAKYL